MKHLVLVIAISLSLFFVNTSRCLALQFSPGQVPQTNSTLNPQAEKIKKQIDKIGLGHDVTVILTDDREFYGALKNIEADGFLIFDVDSRQLLTLKYNEVKKVRKGYGSTRDRSGKRIRPSKALIGSIIAVAAIAIPVIIVVAGMSREK